MNLLLIMSGILRLEWGKLQDSFEEKKKRLSHQKLMGRQKRSLAKNELRQEKFEKPQQNMQILLIY